EDQLGQRLPGPPDVVGLRQDPGDRGDRRLHRLPDATRLLDRDDGGPVGPARNRHLLLVDEDGGLVDLAAEPDEDVGDDVRVLRVPGQHALERPMILAVQHLAAPRLVGDRDDSVDVRVVGGDVPELLPHELADAGRAVDGREDGDVVARAHAAVSPLVAVEVAHPFGRVVVDRLHVHPDLVLLPELADGQVVNVHVVADPDLLGREADDLAVATDGLADPCRASRDLVAGPDVLAYLDLLRTVLDNRARW